MKVNFGNIIFSLTLSILQIDTKLLPTMQTIISYKEHNVNINMVVILHIESREQQMKETQVQYTIHNLSKLIFIWIYNTLNINELGC